MVDCETREGIQLRPEVVGLIVRPGKSSKTPYWKLTDLRVFGKPSAWVDGRIDFLLRDTRGMPVSGIDVLLVWAEGLIMEQTNRRGRARLTVWDTFDHSTGCGKCWAGLVDPSDEVHGIGIPIGNRVVYRLVYTRLD